MHVGTFAYILSRAATRAVAFVEIRYALASFGCIVTRCRLSVTVFEFISFRLSVGMSELGKSVAVPGLEGVVIIVALA